MYKNVLVPLDGSELAECAVPHVINLVKDGAAKRVILLNVVVSNFDWYQIEEGFDYTAFKAALSERSQKYLADVKAQFGSAGIDVETTSVEGSFPAQTITDYAQKNGVDMIVMSTHGRTGIKILMFGSTALSVLHDSSVPVLLIRPASCQK